MMRVQRILSLSGYCSRRRAEELIKEGKVYVNGKKITIGDQADWEKDLIMVGKQTIEKKSDFIYILMHKPPKFLTTVTDMYDRKTVMDLLPTDIPRVVPVGRLDRDAEGLLLFTNDGEFANKVMHPRYTIPKTYRAWLDKPLQKKDKSDLEHGVKLKDGFVRDVKLHYASKNCVDVTIHVGKNKVVKRIFNAAGYRVIRLKRIAIGRLTLGQLKPGSCIKLTKLQAERVFASDGNKPIRPIKKAVKKETPVSKKDTITKQKRQETRSEKVPSQKRSPSKKSFTKRTSFEKNKSPRTKRPTSKGTSSTRKKTPNKKRTSGEKPFSAPTYTKPKTQKKDDIVFSTSPKKPVSGKSIRDKIKSRREK